MPDTFFDTLEFEKISILGVVLQVVRRGIQYRVLEGLLDCYSLFLVGGGYQGNSYHLLDRVRTSRMSSLFCCGTTEREFSTTPRYNRKRQGSERGMVGGNDETRGVGGATFL